MAKQVLDIKVLSCGGMFDLMSEQEASFLTTSLGLFRNREQQGKGLPRANVNLVRAYRASDFYRGFAGDEDLLHLIAHTDKDSLKTGNHKSLVTASEVKRLGDRGELMAPSVIVSTGCNFRSSAWRDALKATGVQVLIAAHQTVTPQCLTAFDMSFYSALLSCIRRGEGTIQRVRASFDLAQKHYEAIHAEGTPHARFVLED